MYYHYEMTALIELFQFSKLFDIKNNKKPNTSKIIDTKQEMKNLLEKVKVKMCLKVCKVCLRKIKVKFNLIQFKTCCF